MKTNSILGKLGTSLAAFKSAKGGNVAVMFGIAIVPIIGFVGAAIDYTRANNARTAMQTALDSTALMLSKDVVGLTATDINKKAQDYFNALYKHPEVSNLNITAAYTANSTDGSKIVMNATGTVKTAFMKVVGYPTMDFGSGSTTVWGTTKLRVALALDNTGSMASAGKMTALKTAAKSLIDQLKAAAKNDGDVYVSIIPFAKDVNIGTANANASWLRWDLGQCNYTSRYRSSALGFMTQTDCTSAGGNSWVQSTKAGWTGCVSDRDNTPAPGYDVLSTAPYSLAGTPTAAQRATQFPAENYPDCPAAILPLTYDWTTLKAKVDEMQPNGNTNQAIGMAWGWLSLLQQAPLNAPVEDSTYKYTKAVILLSDGDNTQNRFSTSVSAIDARQRLLCDNAKAAGITIYTIQVNTDGGATSSVMSYCASSSSNFFATTSANGINTAFSSIGSALSKLRITK